MIARWTPEAVRSLGVMTDIVTAGELLGIGRTKAHELARTGSFPVRVLKLGNQYRVPTAPLLELLGLTPEIDEPAPRSAGTVTTHNAFVEAPHDKRNNGLQAVEPDRPSHRVHSSQSTHHQALDRDGALPVLRSASLPRLADRRL